MGYFKQLEIALMQEVGDRDLVGYSDLSELQEIVRTVLEIADVREFNNYQLDIHSSITNTNQYLVYAEYGPTYAEAVFKSAEDMTHLSKATHINIVDWTEMETARDRRNRVIAGTAFAFIPIGEEHELLPIRRNWK
jgi:hypothetical protein